MTPEDLSILMLDQTMDSDDPGASMEALDAFERIIHKAYAGTIDDSDRVTLFRIALTAAVNEFYALEHSGAGHVNPAVLTLLQQITLICDGNLSGEEASQD